MPGTRRCAGDKMTSAKPDRDSAGYGLNDAETARCPGLERRRVSVLRDHWRIGAER